jgi:hypothetical protein
MSSRQHVISIERQALGSSKIGQAQEIQERSERMAKDKKITPYDLQLALRPATQGLGTAAAETARMNGQSS